MTAAAVALQHAVAITKDASAEMAVETAPFGMGDALIAVEGRPFRRRGQGYSALGVKLGGVEQI